MPDKKYTMIESVGSSYQTIHSYEDIEKHHPSKKVEPGRVYQQIDGKREEVTKSPSGEVMVSKDIIFKVDGVSGSGHVNVPSPFEGYAKLNERWGTVDVYDQPDGKGHLIGRVRHMDPIHVKENQHIKYGEPLGMQGGKGPKGSNQYGTHAHIDVSLSHLDGFKQYIKDVDSGVISAGNYPSKNKLDKTNAADLPSDHRSLGVGLSNAAADHAKPLNGYPQPDWSDTSKPVRVYNETDGTSQLFSRNSDGVVTGVKNLDAHGAEINPKNTPQQTQSIPDHQLNQPQLQRTMS